VKIASNVDLDFDLLKAVINVNNKQQTSLMQQAKERFGSLHRKKITLLGLAFKSNTDDMRQAPSSS
jgi:UDPglucose 6-dehydrogenase